METLTSAIVGGIIGGILGVVGALLAVLVAYWINANVVEFRQRYEERQRLAIALLAELEANRERYWRTFGKYIQEDLKPGQRLDRFGARVTNQNFTVVYDNNADKLGLFDPEDTATIVHAMTVGKGHVESIGQFYEEVSQIVTQMHESMRAGLVDAGKKFGERQEKALVEGGDRLRVESREAVGAVDQAIAVLRDKYTKLGPPPGVWKIIKAKCKRIFKRRS